MRIGALDRRVTIQALSTAADAAGEPIETWTDVRTVWMGRRDMRAAERFAGQQTVAEVDTVFSARWAPATAEIRPETHRLVLDGRVYAVHGVAEIGRREKVEIAAAARAEAAYEV